jgi:uncharacterized protein YebE (UPF0316 family)
MFWEKVWDFFTVTPIWEVLGIVGAKILEVSMETTRVILTVKGYRLKAALIAVVELLLWVFVASNVIVGFAASPMKGVAYVLGYAIGVSIGSRIGKLLAAGQVQIKVITEKKTGNHIAFILRKQHFGVTVCAAEGMKESKSLLIIYASSKKSPALIQIILSFDATAMIVEEEVRATGGFIASGKHSVH